MPDQILKALNEQPMRMTELLDHLCPMNEYERFLNHKRSQIKQMVLILIDNGKLSVGDDYKISISAIFK